LSYRRGFAPWAKRNPPQSGKSSQLGLKNT